MYSGILSLYVKCASEPIWSQKLNSVECHQLHGARERRELKF